MQAQCFLEKLGSRCECLVLQSIATKNCKLGMWLCACMFVVTVRLLQFFSALSLLIPISFFISLSFCTVLLLVFSSRFFFYSLSPSLYLSLTLLPHSLWTCYLCERGRMRQWLRKREREIMRMKMRMRARETGGE